MISKRLLEITKFVTAKDKIIDVGCDHALLDIYLVKHDFVPSLTVSDLRKNALNNAIVNIKKDNLEDKIVPKLGNGLDVLTDENTLIISGMGTKTIIEILKDNLKLEQLNKIIIQSNTDYYSLRKFMHNIGYKIINETIIKDHNKYYLTICYHKGKEKFTENEFKFGKYTFNKDYFNNLINSKKIILNKKKKDNILQEEIEYLKSLIKKMSI